MSDLSKKFSKSILDVMDFKGVSFEFSEKLMDEINNRKCISNIEESINEDELMLCVRASSLDSHMIANVLYDMLRDGEAEIVFTDKATEKNINYLKRLAKIDS